MAALKTHYNPNPNPNPKRRPTASATATSPPPIVFSGGTWCCSDMDYSRFNHALTAGLLNPMSPPLPAAAVDKSRSSPTLFEMMASEQDAMLHRASPAAFQDRQQLRQARVAEMLGSGSPGGRFNDAASGDVKLTLISRDGFSVSLALHRQILAAHSRFFASKLKHHPPPPPPYVVEISDCDDVEIYLETLRLMYCHDLRRRLMREDVPKVLGVLKVSAAIAFDAGVLSCLEYLEAAPWAEDEEEQVAAVLSELRLDAPGAGDVMRRVAPDDRRPTSGAGDGDLSGSGEEILVRLLQVVLAGKDEKARRDMKMMVSKMLRESASHADLTVSCLHEAADECVRTLRVHFGPDGDPTQIARQSDNLHWLLDILIDRQVGDEFAAAWAGEEALAGAHCRVPAIHRHEVSRVTARLLVGIGKGQVLVGKEVRCRLLRTWLDPFYEDFGWMKRACRGLDRHLVEDGLGNTILTLPMDWQQEFLMGWFGRFLNSGDDCPNLQRAFEVWWRRAFWRRNGDAMR